MLQYPNLTLYYRKVYKLRALLFNYNGNGYFANKNEQKISKPNRFFGEVRGIFK